MGEVLAKLNGVGKRLDVYNDRIEFVEIKGFNRRENGNKKTIYINKISSVRIKKNKWLHFSVPGEKDMTSYQEYAYINDCDTAITFTKYENANAEKVKTLVEQLIAEAAKSAATPTQCSGADEIVKYHALLVQGIITQSEFETKKRAILAAI